MSAELSEGSTPRLSLQYSASSSDESTDETCSFPTDNVERHSLPPPGSVRKPRLVINFPRAPSAASDASRSLKTPSQGQSQPGFFIQSALEKPAVAPSGLYAPGHTLDASSQLQSYHSSFHPIFIETEPTAQSSSVEEDAAAYPWNALSSSPSQQTQLNQVFSAKDSNALYSSFPRTSTLVFDATDTIIAPPPKKKIKLVSGASYPTGSSSSKPSSCDDLSAKLPPNFVKLNITESDVGDLVESILYMDMTTATRVYWPDDKSKLKVFSALWYRTAFLNSLAGETTPGGASVTLSPPFWQHELPKMLYAQGDAENYNRFTIWRVEYQLVQFLRDIVSRISEQLGSLKCRVSLDILAQALYPDATAIRLCEYVAGWVALYRRKSVIRADTVASAESDDPDQVIPGSEDENSDDEEEDADAQNAGSPITSWHPPPDLEGKLVAQAPTCTVASIEQQRLEQRLANAQRADTLSDTAYAKFVECSATSFARRKNKFSTFLCNYCGAKSLQFQPIVLECLAVLAADFVSRLVEYAKRLDPQRYQVAGNNIYCGHIRRYIKGQLLSLPAPPGSMPSVAPAEANLM